jgi:hypothetical protein
MEMACRDNTVRNWGENKTQKLKNKQIIVAEFEGMKFEERTENQSLAGAPHLPGSLKAVLRCQNAQDKCIPVKCNNRGPFTRTPHRVSEPSFCFEDFLSNFVSLNQKHIFSYRFKSSAQ